jgi:TPR repeat protein
MLYIFLYLIVDKSRWHPPHLIPKIDPFRERLALIYWTRSANQGNVDSRVKMGDYYFKGFGTEVNYEKAAACYQVAAEVELSAMAMWNLGWMHENGIGVAKVCIVLLFFIFNTLIYNIYFHIGFSSREKMV